MRGPFLTIEDATREFRASAKMIRRRRTSGEIAGAYKRPGTRGPEWVMPREALAAAGFAPRAAAPVAAGIPADAGERAEYLEWRATDAEAALRTAVPEPRRRTDALPAGRVAVCGRAPLRLASFDGSAPPPGAAVTLRSLADVVMRAAHEGFVVELFDRGTCLPGEPNDADGAAPTGRDEPDAAETPAGPAGEVPQPTDEPAPGGTVPGSTAGVADAGVPTATRIQVAAGDSFWTFARTVVARGGNEAPSAEPVTSYWSELASADVHRVVRPGNADLLHPGQTLTPAPLLP